MHSTYIPSPEAWQVASRRTLFCSTVRRRLEVGELWCAATRTSAIASVIRKNAPVPSATPRAHRFSAK